jgi:MFS family permease
MLTTTDFIFSFLRLQAKGEYYIILEGHMFERMTQVASTQVITLLVTCFGLFMVLLDASIVNVALPTIQADLHANLSDLQWVVDAYTLPFAALLLTAGTLGDRFGRKRLFLAGLVLFVLGSTFCGFAPTLGWLLFGRVVQGVGAAALMPAASRYWWRPFPSRASARRPLASGLACLAWPWPPGRSWEAC